MTTMASGFSVARMPLAAAAQSAGSPRRLILDQAGDGLVLADHAHVGLFGIGVLEAVGEPVGHAVAEHQHVALGGGVALVRGRARGKILARRLRRLCAAGTARRNRRRNQPPPPLRRLPLRIRRSRRN